LRRVLSDWGRLEYEIEIFVESGEEVKSVKVDQRNSSSRSFVYSQEIVSILLIGVVEPRGTRDDIL